MAHDNKDKIKWDDKNCEIVYEHLKKGFSLDCVGHKLVNFVCLATIYEWYDTRPNFKEAIDKGRAAGQEWFEQRLLIKASGQDIRGVDNKKIDLDAVKFALRTRFHKTYSDKSQVDHVSSDGSMTPTIIFEDAKPKRNKN